MDERFTYRLALSATLERHRDEEGTATLYNFFGKKCIEYSLEQAINNYKSIANYIETQEERFFNALVLAVYDGVPTWHEVRLEYDDGSEFYTPNIEFSIDMAIIKKNPNGTICS